MAEAQLDTRDGSAEYVSKLLGARGLGCSHYAAKKSKDKSAFPSRLGFFHKTAPDTRISYLETKLLCLDCLYLAVPNGFNFWSLLVDASPGAPDVSKLDAPPSMDLYPPLLKCGTEGFSPGSHPAVEPVIIPIPDVARAKEAWLWLQEERKPFYIDQLHLTTRRLLPLAKRAVQTDAVTVANYGLSFEKRQTVQSAPQVSSPRPTRSTPPTSIVRRKAVGSGASKTRSRIGSNRSLTPQSVAPSVDLERQSTNGSQNISDVDLSILSQATTATSFTEAAETAPKSHGLNSGSVIEVTCLPESNQQDSSLKESRPKTGSKEVKSSKKRKEKKESSKKVKPSPPAVSEATEAIVSVNGLPQVDSKTVEKHQGLATGTINLVATVEESAKTSGKLEEKSHTPSPMTNGSTSASITHSTILAESTTINVVNEHSGPKDTAPSATSVSKSNGRAEATTMNGSVQEHSHDLSTKLAEASTKATESTETSSKPKEKKRKKKDLAETKTAEPSSSTASAPGTISEAIKPALAEGDVKVKKDSSTKTKTSTSTSTNGSTPPQTNVAPAPKQGNPNPVNMLGIMEQGALIKHNPLPQPTTMVYFTSTSSSLPTPNGATNSAPKSLMLSARLLRQKPQSKTPKLSDRPHYTRNWSQYKQIEFESRVLLPSNNAANLLPAVSESKKHRSKEVADDSDANEPTAKKGSKVKDKSTKKTKTGGEPNVKHSSGTKERSPAKQRLSTKDKSTAVKANGHHSGSAMPTATKRNAPSTKTAKPAKVDKPHNHSSGSFKLGSGHANNKTASKPHGSKSRGSGGLSKGGGFKIGFEHSSNKSRSKHESKSEQKSRDWKSSHRHDTDDSDYSVKKAKKKPGERQENKKKEEEKVKPEDKIEEETTSDDTNSYGESTNDEQDQKPEAEEPGPTDLSSPSAKINATGVIEEPECPPATDPAQEETKPENLLDSSPDGPSISAQIDVTAGSPEAGNTTKPNPPYVASPPSNPNQEPSSSSADGVNTTEPDAIQQAPRPPNGSAPDNNPSSASADDNTQSRLFATESGATPNVIPEDSKTAASSAEPRTGDGSPDPSNAIKSEPAQQGANPPGPSAADRQVPWPSAAGDAKYTPPTAENTNKQESARRRSGSPSTAAQQPPSFSVDINATVTPRGRDNTPKPIATPSEQDPNTSTRGYPSAINPPVTSGDAGATESSRAGPPTSADGTQVHPSSSHFQPSININASGFPEPAKHEDVPSSRGSSRSRSSSSSSHRSRDVSPIGHGAYDGSDSESEKGSSSRDSSPARNGGPDEDVSDDAESVKDDANPIGIPSPASSRRSSVSSQWSLDGHHNGAPDNEAGQDENYTDHDHASVDGDGNSSDSESEKNHGSDDEDNDTDKDGDSSDDSDSDQENNPKDSSSDQGDNGDEGDSSSDSGDSSQEDGESEGEDNNDGDSSDQDNSEDGSSDSGGDSGTSDSESNDGDGENSDANSDSDQNDTGSERSDDDQDDRSDSDEESEDNEQDSDQQSEFYQDHSESEGGWSYDSDSD
ncbi:Gram-positive signal peptide YSIRK family [Fusarium albosuccineum]|uniref:Gram-positive signal peptide YSIRK family n=1 Tax=Fusarium albosuccineum TaxID=1237068 RepID=A0A8H4L807_9HYPO|nr:Gram-positive signal peptide YSIRK family [Fusarium albosuccineum]